MGDGLAVVANSSWKQASIKMANKRLNRVLLEEEQLSRLQSKRLMTCRDVLSKTEFELMNVLDCDILYARDIINRASIAASPSKRTLLDVYNNRKEKTQKALKTRMDPLDNWLLGGIPAGSITEVVGPPGTGKTQLCHMLSVLATLPTEKGGLNGSVVYFDTESCFSPERILEIAISVDSVFFSNQDHLVELTTRVLVHSPASSQQAMETLKALEETIIEKNVKLIVVDSVASMIKKEFDGNSGALLAKRQDLLSKEASILKYLAESFNIPVIVTNQVTSKTDNNKRTIIIPALGPLWAHCVNTRLVLESFGSKRRLTIAKSPIAPVASLFYVITSAGLQLSKDGECLTNVENFWEPSIVPSSAGITFTCSTDNSGIQFKSN